MGLHLGQIFAILVKPSFLCEGKSPFGYHSYVLLLVSPWRWSLGSGGCLPFHLIEWGPCPSLRLLPPLPSVFHLHCTTTYTHQVPKGPTSLPAPCLSFLVTAIQKQKQGQCPLVQLPSPLTMACSMVCSNLTACSLHTTFLGPHCPFWAHNPP